MAYVFSFLIANHVILLQIDANSQGRPYSVRRDNHRYHRVYQSRHICYMLPAHYYCNSCMSYSIPCYCLCKLDTKSSSSPCILDKCAFVIPPLEQKSHCASSVVNNTSQAILYRSTSDTDLQSLSRQQGFRLVSSGFSLQ